MLSKTVCRSCINRHGSLFGEEAGWSDVDDDAWHNDCTVSCPMWLVDVPGSPTVQAVQSPVKATNENQYGVSIYQEPPEGCPYTLEHLVDVNAEKESGVLSDPKRMLVFCSRCDKLCIDLNKKVLRCLIAGDEAKPNEFYELPLPPGCPHNKAGQSGDDIDVSTVF